MFKTAGSRAAALVSRGAGTRTVATLPKPVLKPDINYTGVRVCRQRIMSKSFLKLDCVDIFDTQIFINNEFHPSVSGKTFPTINPSTESESPGSSWTPLLHNLSTESIL